MKIRLKKSDYADMTPCCSSSLFEKGTWVPDSARDDWRSDDFGYFCGFPLQWKLAVGFEASMTFYTFDELWVGRDEQFSRLPSNGKEKFYDSIPHYPASADSRFFVATTTEYKHQKWVGHLLIYDLNNSQLLHRITHTDDLGPIQFVDNERVLVLKADGLYLLSVANGKINPLFVADNCVYTNAHLSSDLTCACAIRARNHTSMPTGVTIAHLETGVITTLKFGANANVDDQAKWLAHCTIPFRVDNGMINLVATEVS